MTVLSRAGLAFAVLAIVSAAPSEAQWVDQSFDLQLGWNSIFLEVDPAPAEADQLFAGLPIDAVWSRAAQSLVVGPPECSGPDDPTCVPPAPDEWNVWLPANHPGRVATSLRNIRGGKTYLIHTTQPMTLAVTGVPNGARTSWREGFNHAGFHVVDDPNATPTILDYLAPSAAHAGAVVFETLPDGSPSAIVDLSTARITPGKGYWVSSSSDVEYDGPIQIDNASLRGIDYGVTLDEHALSLQNLSGTPTNVTVAYGASSAVPPAATAEPTLVGDVPMSWFDFGEANPADTFVWHPLSTFVRSMGAADSPDDEDSIRLAVNRIGLPGASVDQNGLGSQYEGVLTVTSDAGFRRFLPVTAQSSSSAFGSTAAIGSMARAGLYYGTVTVDRVSWVTAGARVWMNDDPVKPLLMPNPDGDDTSLRPTPAEFAFPVIIHLSDLTNYKMLTDVTLLFEPEDTTAGTPGRYVLATSDCDPLFCDALMAGSVQDGQPFARRLSTANFSFTGDLSLTGAFATALTGSTTIAADDPLNPFHHRYHPDHDCDQNGECYEITRTMTFTFDTVPPPGEQVLPGWGDTHLTGTYSESIQGLYSSTVNVAGRFEITRVSTIATLNGQ